MFQQIIGFLAPRGLREADSLPALARKAAARLATGVRYLRALRELNRLDDRDLDDLAIGRHDLPALALRHASGMAPLVRLPH
ncbi:MAG TPA: DUF1127 domain-containing protein [Geminicoccaceae bacterium]|nr:DUF1127 domain-containing protein [Geminicoccus sp.]HMU48430.1 DUF1127 domain-containing protein [Geminicoccaceae bacterium]